MRQYVFQPAGEAENDAIHAGLRAYNRKFVPDTGDLSLAVKDADGRVVGGCDAFRMGELAFVDVLWVAEDCRGAGLGGCILDQLEAGHLLGNVLGVGAGMAFACYYMSLEGASESERMSAILMAHGLTFCVSIPFIALEPPELGAAPVICIFILGVVQLGIPYVLLGRASGSCPPLACSLLGAVEPLLNPVWVFIFDGEAPGMWALIGGVVVVVTITVWCVYGDLREKAEKA